MTDRIGAATVNGVARRLMAAVARSLGEAQSTGDVADLRGRVQLLEARVAALEAMQRAAPRYRNIYDSKVAMLSSDHVAPSVHAHTVRDCPGHISCGLPGCCAVPYPHS
jgi:hypothetical protein